MEERFDDLNELLIRLQKATPSRRVEWECLRCARVCNLAADDYCPTCGEPLPPLPESPDA